MENFKPSEDLPEEDKQHCVKLIEKGMSYCSDCGTDTVEQIQDACMKHKKMYGKIYP